MEKNDATPKKMYFDDWYINCFLMLKSLYVFSPTEYAYAEDNENISADEISIGLNKQIDYYTSLLDSVDGSEIEEIDKINDLLSTTYAIATEYQNTQNSNSRSANAVDSLSVATIISYFSNKGYVLAAELLTHMRDNKSLNSIYKPVNGSRVIGTTAFNNILNGNIVAGSTTFSNDGTTLGSDAYFSLNKCSFTKASNSRAVVLTDRYDYDTSGYGWTIQGIAVDAMYKAQQSGYLTPFYTVITQEVISGASTPIPIKALTISSTDSRNRYLEEIITLGKGDYKDYTITYSIGGNKVFQTFGYNDTFLELYDSQGTMLTSDDDSGYGTNALLSYNFVANKTYKVRVKFYNSAIFGETRLLGTAASSIAKYENIFSMDTSPSGIVYSYTGINETKFYSYTPTSKKAYTLKLDGQVDGEVTGMYLYILDPRSTVPVVSETYASTTYSPNQYSFIPPATIVKELDQGIPYLIIVSKSGMSSQAFYSLSIS